MDSPHDKRYPLFTEDFLRKSNSCSSSTEEGTVADFGSDLRQIHRCPGEDVVSGEVTQTCQESESTHNHPLSFLTLGIQDPPASRQDHTTYRDANGPTSRNGDILPESLRAILFNGLSRSSSRLNAADAGLLADIVIQQAEKYAQEKKKEVRANLKRGHPALSKSVPVHQRSVFRSRIEAQASRAKGGELNRVLKSIIRWIIENRCTSPPAECECFYTYPRKRRSSQ